MLDFNSTVCTRSALLVAVALSVPLRPAAPAAGAHPQVFRTAIQSVPVYATVQNDAGRLVPDLPREAFQVFDDGRPVEITAFSTDPQPLSVAVMLDASQAGLFPINESTGKAAPALRDAIVAFMRALRPQDRARLGTFGVQIAVGAHLTNDVAEVDRVLREEYWTGMGAGTPLWQAISEALASLSFESGRRVVLVVTGDGRDTGSLPGWRGSRTSVERQLLAQDGMLFVIRPALWHSDRPRMPLRQDIVTLAESTGGGYFEVPKDADPETVFTRIADELRHQYLLGFSPSILDGKEHQIEVRMTRPGLKARARKSYLAEAAR